VLGFLKAPLMSKFSSQQFVVLLSQMNEADLLVLRDLLQAGKVKPVIDRSYAFADIPAAIRYLESQRARGKVVVTRD
jgi:NADPH:quinone reductase-like Zn-dependent oxidoreductase